MNLPRTCRICGRPCYGRECRACHSRGKYGKLTIRRCKRRYLFRKKVVE